MKRKSAVALILCMVAIMAVSSASLCGCEKKKDENNQSVGETTEDTDLPDTKTDDDKNTFDDNNKEDDSVVNEKDDESKQTSAVSAGDCLKAYQDFLKGDAKVSLELFEKCDEYRYGGNSWDIEEIDSQFKKWETYTISEFTEGICRGHAKYYDMRISLPKSISYAYIDCGKDGIPELALLYDTVGNNSITDSFIVIIKLVDDKLQCIFSNRYAYRAFATLGEYGIFGYGGSNGAISNTFMRSYINENGETTFLYGVDDSLAASGLYIPDNTEYLDVAYEEGIADYIEIEQYFFEMYQNDMDYKEYVQNCDYVYYPLSNNCNRLEGDRLKEALADGSYERFWKSTGLKNMTSEEIEKKIQGVLDGANVTDEILNGEEADWIELSASDFDSIVSWKSSYEAPTLVLDVPSWDYYYAYFDKRAATNLSLTEVSKTGNQITDEDVWFSKLGTEQPNRLSFSDAKYEYKLFGEDPDGLLWYPYMMDIYDLSTNEKLYTLDFSKYYTPDACAPGDERYVEESIHWAVSDNDVLYVSTFHNTYASSAPHNGYITAFDMKNDFKVMWRSTPLVCNSNNFLVTDDAIICGYGFTAEDDYVYVLDKNSGLQTEKYKVKTSPDWFIQKGDTVYVRCYDMDYEFKINR